MLPAGILGGMLATTVGMASLATYPALLYLGGLPPVLANVTNTSAMIWTGVGSGLSSLPELKGHWMQTLRTVCLTSFGSVLGTLLLLKAPSSSFQKVVPFFILFSGIMILRKKKPDTGHSKKAKRAFHLFADLGIIFMGGYAGYFGAAAGVIMISILSRITDESYPEYNAVKNMSMFAANMVALIFFIFMSKIAWLYVISMGLGLFIGGYIGPKIVRIVPGDILKKIVGIGAFILTAILFYQAY